MSEAGLCTELARATEAAALAVYPHLGSGDLQRVDQSAVDAMRDALAASTLDGCIAIGEGEKDQAPWLHNGEQVGRAGGRAVDLAVDPIDGTRAAATGRPGSVAALAAAPPGRMFRPQSVAYMEKLIGPPSLKGRLHLDMPAAALVAEVSLASGKPPAQVRVAILDRPRNAPYVAAVRETGAQVVALPDADLSACIGVALQCANLDLLVGIGGCPEGVIAATAASALGAFMETRLWARHDEEEQWAREHGLSTSKIFDAPALVGDRGLGVVLTGVTGSEILDPAREDSGELIVHTLRIDSESGASFTRTPLRRLDA